MLKRRGRIEKAAQSRRLELALKSSVVSAQSNVAGDGQKQDASLIEDKRKPSFVIKLCHWICRTIMFLFYHHAIMIAENGSKIKKKHVFAIITCVLCGTYET